MEAAERPTSFLWFLSSDSWNHLELDRVPVGAARRICRPPERRGAGKGAPVLGAAKRTLAGEHRSGMPGK